MKFAIIENGIVTNIAEATEDYGTSQGWINVDNIVCHITWSYVDGVFSPPPRNIDLEWEIVRSKRDKLLQESDIKVLPDLWNSMPIIDQEKWSTYRQQLRDIPQTFSDPLDVIFPTKPN